MQVPGWSFPADVEGCSHASLIVISLCKIRDRDWSYTRHMICMNNQYCSKQQHPGEHVRLAMHLRLILGSNAVLGRSSIYSVLHLLTL